MCSEKNLNIECEKNSNSLSDEYMLEVADASFNHIDEILQSVSKVLDNHLFQENPCREPKTDEALRSRALKATMLSDLVSKITVEDAFPILLTDYWNV